MKIVNERPPIYDSIISAGMNPSPTVIYTYGDTIYNPGGGDLADHTIEHEETHCDQQGSDPDGWWSRYLVDAYFRTEQEAEAYGRQYAYICATVTDRNRRHKVLFDLARILSGPIYGSVIGHTAAMKMIKEKSGIK